MSRDPFFDPVNCVFCNFVGFCSVWSSLVVIPQQVLPVMNKHKRIICVNYLHIFDMTTLMFARISSFLVQFCFTMGHLRSNQLVTTVHQCCSRDSSFLLFLFFRSVVTSGRKDGHDKVNIYSGQMAQRKTDEADTEPTSPRTSTPLLLRWTSRNCDDAKRLRSYVVVTFCWKHCHVISVRHVFLACQCWSHFDLLESWMSLRLYLRKSMFQTEHCCSVPLEEFYSLEDLEILIALAPDVQCVWVRNVSRLQLSISQLLMSQVLPSVSSLWSYWGFR